MLALITFQYCGITSLRGTNITSTLIGDVVGLLARSKEIQKKQKKKVSSQSSCLPAPVSVMFILVYGTYFQLCILAIYIIIYIYKE